MFKSWKTILVIVVVLGIATAAIWAYQSLIQSKKANLPVIAAVSPSAIFFMETTQPAAALENLGQSEIWKYLLSLEGLQHLAGQYRALDSVLKATPQLTEQLAHASMILSLQVDENELVAPLFMLAHPNPLKNLPVRELETTLFGDENLVLQKLFKEVPIRVMNLPGQKNFFYYTYYRGIFAGSFSESMVKQTISQLNSGNDITQSPGLSKVRQTAGTNVDANLYINGSQFGKWAAGMAAAPNQSAFNELMRFWSWTEADLVLNKDELLLNGYSVASENEKLQLLNAFRQEPQDITIPDVLPSNTAYMFHFGLAEFDKFYARFMQLRSDSAKTLETLKKYNDLFGIAPYDEFISWMGTEVALAGITDAFNQTQPLVVIRTSDVLKARISLIEVSKKVDRRMLAKSFEEVQGDYRIYKLGLPEFNQVFFGSLFKPVTQNYFVLLKDYVLLANTPEVLKEVLEWYYKGKTLAGDINYNTFSNNISARSNIFIYSNIRKSAGAAPQLFKSPFSNWLDDNAGMLGNLEGVAMQLSFINQMFYTNIFLKYNPDYREVNPSSWVFETETPVTRKPYLIRNHRNNKLNTIVFDAQNTMYLADHMGKIKWTLPLIEPPLGELIQIDFYGNGKYQYLFNTSNYIYVVDLNGEYVEDFPFRLPQSATGPVACFDYDNNNDYRLVIPLSDNRIYNFDKYMKQVEGWNKIQCRANVQQAVEHLVAADKDFLIVKDIHGKVLITDRRGEQRISPDADTEVSMRNGFYVNKTNSNGIFITTSPAGELLYFSENGEVKSTGFGQFTNDHHFVYADFDGDRSEDFIFVDNQKVSVFNRFKKILFEYSLPHPVLNAPMVFASAAGNTVIALVLQNTGEALFLDITGPVFVNAAMTGTAGMAIGNINNDAVQNAILPNEKLIKNYALE